MRESLAARTKMLLNSKIEIPQDTDDIRFFKSADYLSSELEATLIISVALQLCARYKRLTTITSTPYFLNSSKPFISKRYTGVAYLL